MFGVTYDKDLKYFCQNSDQDLRINTSSGCTHVELRPRSFTTHIDCSEQMSLADELSDDYDSDLDRRDPMRNIRTEIHARDLASELLSALPGQHYSVLGDTVRLFFNDRGDNEDQRPVTLDILADASPGCGGVVWPAGTVN